MFESVSVPPHFPISKYRDVSPLLIRDSTATGSFPPRCGCATRSHSVNTDGGSGSNSQPAGLLWGWDRADIIMPKPPE